MWIIFDSPLDFPQAHHIQYVNRHGTFSMLILWKDMDVVFILYSLLFVYITGLILIG